jgi:hypothetical protein
VTRREQLYPEIKRLREQEGLTWREIGARMGLARQTVHAYYTDPDGVKVYARKHRGRCRHCGAATYTANPGRGHPIERCNSCSRAHLHEASRAWIIDRIQAWAERFGDPPVALDWNRAPSSRRRNPAAALRQDEAADEDWPAASGVQGVFGSWNAAIEAAGFTPVRPTQQRSYPGAMKEAA